MSELLSLPDELLVMIISYCSSSDLLQISQVCVKLNEITCDRQIVRVVNFHYNTELNQDLVRKFLIFRPRAENIITIDLTSCYWLTSTFLYDVIGRLRNVENVLVADTRLTAKHLKSLLTVLPRLKRLSWTWREGMDTSDLNNVLRKLVFLYLCVPNGLALKYVVSFLYKCVELKELWINCLNPYSTDYSQPYLLHLDRLERVILHPWNSAIRVKTPALLKQYWQSNSSFSTLDANQLKEVEAMYANDWHEVSHVVQLGSIGINRVFCPVSAEGKAFEVLSMLCELEALNLVLSDKFDPDVLLLDRLRLRELSLDVAAGSQVCSEKVCNTASCGNLKWLSLPVQALTCNSVILVPLSNNASKKRVSKVLDTLPSGVETPFSKMVHSTPHVEVFEIGVSRKDYKPWVPNNLQWDFMSLSAIKNWENLTCLTLAHLPINHGKFFTPMLSGCKRLKSLRIIDLGPLASCIYTVDLCNALTLCKELEDFYWRQSSVGRTSKVWTALQQLPSLKRIALYLYGSSDIENVDVCKTMEKCALLFFLFVASSTTKTKLKQMKQNIISRWSKVRSPLHVWFGWPSEAMEGMQNCPLVHMEEMLLTKSRILGMPTYASRYLSFGKREWALHL